MGIERSQTDLMFDVWLRTKQCGVKAIVFPVQLLELENFQDLVAWDVEADDLCGQAIEDGAGVVVCVDWEDHAGEHFGGHSFGIEPPGLI